ncbi:MAG: putative metalloprotease CJM1_0395 family protein [Spongiibacteraceae bacterium]
MSSIGIGSGPSYQPITPSYSPLGKPAAGLESVENKDQALPPVEESSASDKTRQQPNQKAEATSDKEKGKGRERDTASELTDAEEQEIRELAVIDREVRAHEAAHQAVGGSLAGAASFRFAIGPDGKRYAVGGEVPITIATSDDPQLTIRNARQVRAAALAPAQPSAQDRSVASEAVQIIAQAQLDAALQRAATLQANEQAKVDGAPPVDRSGAVDSFQSNSGQILSPGSLLDQRS